MSDLLPELEAIDTMPAAARGDGRVFRHPRSRYWHMAYCVNGQEYRESTRETDEVRARTALARRLVDMRAHDRAPGRRPLALQTFADLIASIVQESAGRTATGFLYGVRAGSALYMKIGTTADLQTRISELQVGCPDSLAVLFAVPGDRHLERHVHRALRPWHHRGEWFLLRAESLAAVRNAIRLSIKAATK